MQSTKKIRINRQEIEISKKTNTLKNISICGVVFASIGLSFLFSLCFVLITMVAHRYSYVFGPSNELAFKSFDEYFNFVMNYNSFTYPSFIISYDIESEIIGDKIAFITNITFLLAAVLSTTILGIVCWFGFAKNYKKEYDKSITANCVLCTFFLGIFAFFSLNKKINKGIYQKYKKENQLLEPQIQQVPQQSPYNGYANNTINNNPSSVFNNGFQQNPVNPVVENSTRNKLIEINKLRQSGLISEEEYKNLRSEIIESLS